MELKDGAEEMQNAAKGKKLRESKMQAGYTASPIDV